MIIYVAFRPWLVSVAKSGGANSELAREILKHTAIKDAGLNTVERDLYRAGMLDTLREGFNILEKAFRADMQAAYQAEKLELAKALGVYSGNPLLHNKNESFDPNFLTATQLAKRLRIKPTTIVYRARKGKESFEQWSLKNYGEAWSFKMCEANYGLDTVRRYFRC